MYHNETVGIMGKSGHSVVDYGEVRSQCGRLLGLQRGHNQNVVDYGDYREVSYSSWWIARIKGRSRERMERKGRAGPKLTLKNFGTESWLVQVG